MVIKDITLITVLTAILIIQKLLLSFLPNVQLTVLLLVLYTKVLGVKKTTFILLIYVVVDNLILASMSLYFTPFMFLGWLLIILITKLFFSKTENSYLLALAGAIGSLVYSSVYYIPNYFFYDIDLYAYMISDIPFVIVLMISSFLTIMWLYKPLSRKLRELVIKYEKSES